MILIIFIQHLLLEVGVGSYGDTQNLPVAVVNEDKSVNYQGEKFAVGKQVERFKKNNDLDWHFVSAKNKQGLKTGNITRSSRFLTFSKCHNDDGYQSEKDELAL